MGARELFDLTGKVAVVTGGSRGLGREMVLAFAEAGADIVIASRKLENCEEVAAEIRQRFGRKALAVGTHVGDWEQCNRLADAAYETFGKVDVLVNNAGMSPLYDHIGNVPEALYDKVLDVNLKGPFRLTANIGTRMQTAGSGSIIFVSSTASLHPRGNVVTYAAAKAGVNALAVAFADAFHPKVRVNVIIPGPFLTDIAKAWDMEGFNARAKETIMLGRGGEPNEIVGAALYFASEASSFTTGAQLVVSGGSST